MKRFIKWFYPYLADSIAYMFYYAGLLTFLYFIPAIVAKVIIGTIWVAVMVYERSKISK